MSNCKSRDARSRVKKFEILKKFEGKEPIHKGENNVPGTTIKFTTKEKEIALTFDACKGEVDWKLINYLLENRIPATLFWTVRWINENHEAAKKIASSDLFEIQNHGFDHKPCLSDKSSVYGIASPENGIDGIYDEIEKGNRAIEAITGKKTKFYRSGTAYYDDICVDLAKSLGYEIAGFSVLGDCGATYSKERVRDALLSAKSGDIVILHMNHPEKETAEGVIDSIPLMKKQGFKFVKLSDVKNIRV